MRSFLAWSLAVLLVLSGGGCAVEHRVVVSARALYTTMPERQARGESVVEATDLTDDGARPTPVTIKRGASLGLVEGKMRLAELEHGCRGGSTVMSVTPAAPAPASQESAPADTAAPVAPAVLVVDPVDPGCPLLQYADSQFEVRRYDVIQPPSLGMVIGITALTGLGAAAVCEFACPEGSTVKRASDVTLIVAGTALAGMLVWAFIDCMGRWGQPGCRD